MQGGGDESGYRKPPAPSGENRSRGFSVSAITKENILSCQHLGWGAPSIWDGRGQMDVLKDAARSTLTSHIVVVHRRGDDQMQSAMWGTMGE
jgi:hypothetical protein